MKTIKAEFLVNDDVHPDTFIEDISTIITSGPGFLAPISFCAFRMMQYVQEIKVDGKTLEEHRNG
jgi:hypothetical protein